MPILFKGGYLLARIGHLNTAVGWILLVVLAIVLLFLTFFIATCLWEKQYLAGDVEPAQPPFPYTPIPYWVKTREEAARIGLWFAGDFATCKGAGVVRGLETFFFSADHVTLVSILAASTAGAKLKKTVLRTRLENGRILESTDNPMTRDVTRVIENRVLLNAGIEELMSFHLQRIHHAGSRPVPFSPGAALAENERIQLERGQRLVAAGLARWINPQQTCLRLNLRGAFAYLKDMLSNMAHLEDQRMRVDVKRAG